MRKPYANAVLEMRRYASFIATSNLKICAQPTLRVAAVSFASK